MKKFKLTLTLLLVLLMAASLISCDNTDIKEIDGDFTDDIKNIVQDTSDDISSNIESETLNTQPAISETTITETICFEYNGLVVKAKEIVDDAFWGAGIKLYIENNSDKDYTVGLNQAIVNNCMVTASLYCNVASGKKANDEIYLSSSDLEAAGINNIGQIELYFYLSDSVSYERVYETECITIKTSHYYEMDTTVDDTGHTLYENGGIKIVGKYVDESTFWGSSVLLYIENTSNQNITVSCNDMSINGFMVSEFFSATVYAGKYAIDNITVFASDLEENNITSIDEIELKFRIYNSDTYQTIVETDAINFSTK